MSSSFYLAVPLMALLAIVQAAVLPRFPVLDTDPQLFLLVVISWTLLSDLQEGALWAFAGGFFMDLFSSNPLGISSLSLLAAVAVVVLIQRNFPVSRLILPMLLTGLATLVYWFVYLLLLRITMTITLQSLDFLGLETLSAIVRRPDLVGTILGRYGIDGPMLEYIVVLAGLHALLVLPIYWAFYSLRRVRFRAGVEL